jgi:hypothetical protein
MWDNITYFFRRKYEQISRVIDFLPIIWNGFDFDYRYSTELFKHQLKRQADYMESEKGYTTNCKFYASRIRTAIRLMEKVEDEYYACEYQDKIKELYGDNVLDLNFIPCEDNSEYTTLKYEYESWENADEIREVERKLFLESNEKQKRAHKLLWDFIEHNIQGWWD